MTRIADDFDAIGARMRELRGEPVGVGVARYPVADIAWLFRVSYQRIREDEDSYDSGEWMCS